MHAQRKDRFTRWYVKWQMALPSKQALPSMSTRRIVLRLSTCRVLHVIFCGLYRQIYLVLLMKRFLTTSLVCGQLGVLGRSNSQRDSLVVDSSAGNVSDIVSCACPPLPPPLPLQPSAQLG